MKQQVTTKRFIGALFSVTSWIYALSCIISYYISGSLDHSVLYALITFGDSAAPSDIAQYFDSVFTQSLPHVRKKLTDNIGADNAILDAIMKGEAYEEYNGGTAIEEPLLTALATMDWYDGDEELPDTDVDGVTMAIYEAKQAVVACKYSMKDIIRNRNKILDFVKTKLAQSEGGIAEGFAQSVVVGAGDGATRTARTGSGGSSAISPLAKLVDFTPTTSTEIGNINQSTDMNGKWRNQTKTSTASTYSDLILEFNNLYNTCSLGTGGQPKMLIVDQVTFEAVNAGLYIKYRAVNSDNNFSFNNTKLPFGNGKCIMVMDEKMYDAYTDLVPAAYGGAGLTYGTGVYLNTSFLKLRYVTGRDFEMLVDENGKTFAKPIKGDNRLGHIAWMGELTTNNRRKHGVLGKVARTFTNS